MNPRNKTSVKWTALPPEFCEQIRTVFKETFEKESLQGDFFVEGRIYPMELLIRIGYLENDRLLQSNFEVSLDFNAQKQNAIEAIHFAIDSVGSMMSEYFESEQQLDDFPREWESFTFEGREAFMRISTVNTKLEAEANKILGVQSDDLVQGDTEVEDEQAVVTMLGLDQGEEDFPDDDDSDSDKGPGFKH